MENSKKFIYMWSKVNQEIICGIKMKIGAIPFNPIRRTYDKVEVLHATNKSNEDYIAGLIKKNPNLKVVKIKKTRSDLHKGQQPKG